MTKTSLKYGMYTNIQIPQQGASAVEFAIILPLLLLMLFGIVEFGLYLFNRQVITNACREGARSGIIVRIPRLSNAEINQIVNTFTQQHLVTFSGDNSLDVTIKTPVQSQADINDPATQRCLSFACTLEVRAEFIYHFLLLSTIGIGPVQIDGLARMRME